MSPRMSLNLSIILQKATELVNEYGLDQLTLGTLAKELHIRPPSLYNHVNGLNGIKQELAIYGLKKQYEFMIQAVAGLSGDEAIRALSWAYVKFVRTHPGLYQAINHFPESEDLILQQAQQQLVDLVVQVLQAYQLKEDISLHMVRGLRSILHGFTSIERMDGFKMPLDMDISLTILIDTFIQGIHANAENGEGLDFPKYE